jgi:hypothetical protein
MLKRMFDKIGDYIQSIFYFQSQDEAKYDLHTAILSENYGQAKDLMEKYGISVKDAKPDPDIHLFPETFDRIDSRIAWNVHMTNSIRPYQFARENGMEAEDLLSNKLKTYMADTDLTENVHIENYEAHKNGTTRKSLHWMAAKKVPDNQEHILDGIPNLQNMVKSAKFFDPVRKAERHKEQRDIELAHLEAERLKLELDTNTSLKRRFEGDEETSSNSNKRPR